MVATWRSQNLACPALAGAELVKHPGSSWYSWTTITFWIRTISPKLSRWETTVRSWEFGVVDRLFRNMRLSQKSALQRSSPFCLVLKHRRGAQGSAYVLKSRKPIAFNMNAPICAFQAAKERRFLAEKIW